MMTTIKYVKDAIKSIELDELDSLMMTPKRNITEVSSQIKIKQVSTRWKYLTKAEVCESLPKCV